MFIRHRANDGGGRTIDVCLQPIQGCIGHFGRHNGNKHPFVGNIKWIKSQQFASPVYFFQHRNGAFFQVQSQTGIPGQFI